MNEATQGDGGGIEVTAGYGGFQYSQIYANTAKVSGGGVSAATTEVVKLQSDSTDVYGNSAGADGGGIFSWAELTVDSGEVSGNDSARAGGIYVSVDGPVEFFDVLVDGNSATGDGGGIFVSDGSVTSSYLTVTNNEAGGKGGGVYVDSGHPDGVQLAFDLLAGNTAGVAQSAGGYVDPMSVNLTWAAYTIGKDHQTVWFDNP